MPLLAQGRGAGLFVVCCLVLFLFKRAALWAQTPGWSLAGGTFSRISTQGPPDASLPMRGTSVVAAARAREAAFSRLGFPRLPPTPRTFRNAPTNPAVPVVAAQDPESGTHPRAPRVTRASRNGDPRAAGALRLLLKDAPRTSLSPIPRPPPETETPAEPRVA